MSEQRKAADRVVFEVWSTGDLDRLDGLVASDVVHHDPYDRHATEGLAGLKQAIVEYRQAFPDARFTVEDQLAEGDKVLSRWSSRGTHLGSLAGETPTGKVVECSGMVIERFEGDQVVEAWRKWDALALLTRIGVMGPVRSRPATDPGSVDPVEVVRDWYRQVNDGDIEAAVAKLHPQVEWIEADHSPYGRGPLVGIDAIVRDVWSKLAQDWEQLRVVAEEYRTAGSTVVVIGRYVGTRRGTGTELDAQAVHVWDLDDSGLITRYRGFADTYALHQALAAD